MKLREDSHKTFDLHVEQGPGDPFAAAVRWSRMPMVFADPRQVDMPVVYANDAFCRLSGYALDEIVGRNCRILQGPETDTETLHAIREALAEPRAIGIDILNYRKDGTTFWNALYVSPVFNEAGELLYFFSSQFDATERLNRLRDAAATKLALENQVTERTYEVQQAVKSLERALEEKSLLLHEIDHRVKNNLQTISTLIAMQMRISPEQAPTLTSLRERVDAIGAVHRRLHNNGLIGRFKLNEMVEDLVPEILKASANSNIELDLRLEPVELDNACASPLGLIVNELTTNAVRHAWAPAEPGTLLVTTSQRGRHAVLVIADDGLGMPPEAPTRPMSGLKLTEALVRQIQGTISRLPGEKGTSIEIGVPISD